MGQILRNWRTITAGVFALVIVGGAYFFARGGGAPVAQASAEAALLAAIAARDTDGDGLSDWEEALYGTDPKITDSEGLGMTDGEGVAQGLLVPKAIADIPTPSSGDTSTDANGLPPPAGEGTLTEAFARLFFSNYISAKQGNGGADFSDNEVGAIMEQTIASLSSAITAAPDYKSASDLSVSGSGIAALQAFAAGAEAVFLTHKGDALMSETKYLEDALAGDEEALSHLINKAKSYRETAAGLAALPVPAELAAADAALISAMMRMSEIAADFARVNDDPLAAMLALKQYLPTAEVLGSALGSVGNVYAASGTLVPAGSPGAAFIQEVMAVAAHIRAVQTP